MRVITPLEKELKTNTAFDRMTRIQEARAIAPDTIEWMEELQSQLATLRLAVAALINQSTRRELLERQKSATKDNDS
jgi:hypothetical protein